MGKKKESKTGFSSPSGEVYNKKISAESEERKKERFEEKKRQELIIEKEWEEFARQIQENENEQLRIAQDCENKRAIKERKRKRTIHLETNKKTYCCCGQDRKGGKCAEAQIILKSYISTQNYASGYKILIIINNLLIIYL